MEAEAEAEAIGQRHLVVDHVARIDGVVLLRQVTRDDVAAVRRHIEADVGGPGRRPALKQRAQCSRVSYAIFVETQIVEEKDEGALRRAQEGKEARQAVQFIDRAL